MNDAAKTTGWQPIETAPRDGRKFIGWDGWQQYLASYVHGNYLATYGQAEDNRRSGELVLWHALPENPKNVKTQSPRETLENAIFGGPK